MAERLQKLYSLPNAQYTLTCPVIVEAGNLLRDTNTGKLIVQIKVKNISVKPVSAVKVALTTYEANGSALPEMTEHQFLDLNVERDQDFGQKTPIYLNGETARSYKVAVTEVVFAYGAVWKADPVEVIELPAAENLHAYFSDNDLVEEYQIENETTSIYVPVKMADLWRCTCGAINRASEHDCHACGLPLDVQLLRLHSETLSERMKVRKAEEAAELAAQQEAETARRAAIKKRTFRIAIATVLVCAIIGGIFTYTNVIAPKVKYNRAVESLESGKYAEALAVFESLGDYEDSSARIPEAQMGIADAAYEAGDYTTAIETYQLVGTSEAQTQIKACNYQMMLKAIAAENWNEASELYSKARPYENTEDYHDQIQLGKASQFVAEEAYDDALKILETYTDNEEFQAEILPLYHTCLYHIGVAYYENKEYVNAANTLEKLLDNETYSADATEYYYLSAKALYEEDKDDAVKYFEKISFYKDVNDYLPKVTTKVSSNSSSTDSEILKKLQGKWYCTGLPGPKVDSSLVINGNTCTWTDIFYTLEGSYPDFIRVAIDFTVVGTHTLHVNNNNLTLSATKQTYYETDGSVADTGNITSTTYRITTLTDSMLEFDGWYQFYRV